MMDWCDGGWCGGPGTGWGWVFGALVVLGVLLLVAALVLLLLRGVGSAGARGPAAAPGARGGRGREILDERYARGEISTEEYRERLRTLTEGGPGS